MVLVEISSNFLDYKTCEHSFMIYGVFPGHAGAASCCPPDSMDGESITKLAGQALYSLYRCIASWVRKMDHGYV